MSKYIDSREREEEVLALLIDGYVKESKPISSQYLCQKYRLGYSSATVRNILLELEKKGLIAHTHTSSGRVPTMEGFKHYVRRLNDEKLVNEYPVNLEEQAIYDINPQLIIYHALDELASLSGYASIFAVCGESKQPVSEENVVCRGTRFILDQPEFEDVRKLKQLLYALEVQMKSMQEVLQGYLDEDIKILIGDDTGIEGVTDCSLVVSGSRDNDMPFTLAVIGPMRMDYAKAASCIYAVKNQVKGAVKGAYNRKRSV